MGLLTKRFVPVVAAEALTFALLSSPASPQHIPQAEKQTSQEKKAEQESKKRENELLKELDTPHRKWLEEDVKYIITPEERSAFLHLSTNEEREQFVETFWARRNPDPDSPENAFKEEHYRRIAYANEHFASGIPGWKTDRGRIYIMWGPPDEIDSHPSGGPYDRPPAEGGGETETYPFEEWRYRELNLGWQETENVELEFVDTTMTGEYKLTIDPSEKDALLYVPGAGPTVPEMMGLSNKTARFTNSNGTHLGTPLGGQAGGYDEFGALDLYSKIFQPPPVKFKDLAGYSTEHLVRDQIKFNYHFDFLRITSDTVLVPITVQIPTRQLMFVEKNGVDSATLNLFARVSTLSERTVQTFEDTLSHSVPAALLQQSLATSQIYQKEVPLSPGLYRLDIVIKDTASGNVGVASTALRVPLFQEDRLATSSLILADEMHPVSSKDVGLGQFVLGDLKVRPKIDGSFSAQETMGVFLQVYNLKVDPSTKKPDVTGEIRIFKDKAADPALTVEIPKDQLPRHGEEFTLRQKISLASLPPGNYKLDVAITDNLSKQTVTPEARFTVKGVGPSMTAH